MRRVGSRTIVSLLLFLSAAPGRAQDTEPQRLEPVVVTVTRMEQQFGEAPASVTVLTRRDVSQSASQALDDLLRQVPGFSLFRRSSSLVGHPTTQGLSLRGIGPSGASRALVLLDGVPINDPFGGWVYWDKIPLASVEQVEVVRGGGSSLWGNYALSGVVNIITRRPTERALSFESSYGNHDTLNLDLYGAEARGPFRLSAEVSHFQTDGYPVVKASRRGAIDINADSDHTTFNGRAELYFSRDLSFFARGTYYEEDRGNGTPLQNNDTRSGSFAGGGHARTGDGSDWSFSLSADVQRFTSTFSTQALDRNSETLALDQTVPSLSAGGGLTWSRQFGSHLALAGADLRWIEGETHEKVFNAGVFARRRDAGGQQVLAGVFVQDVWTPDPAWQVVGGMRADYWDQSEGFRRDRPPPAGVPPHQHFADTSRLGWSPRVAALFHATPTTDLRASAYQGFRVPTINELYRPFRVRNDVTVANARLVPERLTGGELGVQQRWGPLEGRVTGYWNEVNDLIANVTLTSPLPDCPAGTTCRQRQNLDLARIRGIETELELRLARDWRLLASYIFTDTTVLHTSKQKSLEGKRLAQVPEHGVSLGVRYENPALVNVSVNARYTSSQFEDDLNTLPLGSYWVVDLFLSRKLTKWSEVFFGIENVLDTTYSTGRTSEGVVSIGAPFLVHGGVRLNF